VKLFLLPSESEDKNLFFTSMFYKHLEHEQHFSELIIEKITAFFYGPAILPKGHRANH
jgi:hypothetical protein